MSNINDLAVCAVWLRQFVHVRGYAEAMPSLCRAYAEAMPSLCRAYAEPTPSVLGVRCGHGRGFTRTRGGSAARHIRCSEADGRGGLIVRSVLHTLCNPRSHPLSATVSVWLTLHVECL